MLSRRYVLANVWLRTNTLQPGQQSEPLLIAQKANALAPNWGSSIFQSAHEITANTAIRGQLEELLAQADSEKQWWEKRRSQIQTDFMKELDGSEPSSSTKTGSEEDAVLVDNPSKSKKKGAKK